MIEEPKNRNITLNTLAEKLGVSTGTVSLALNGKPGVNPATREMVLKCATEMNYRHYNMRPLLKQIGVIVPRLSDSFISEIVTGIESIATEYEYDVIIHSVEKQYFKGPKVINHLAEKVDGLIVFSGLVQERLYKKLLADGIKTVYLGPEKFGEAPTVMVDSRAACTQVIDHLAELGHRKVIYCYGNSRYSELRYKISRELAKAGGMTLVPCVIEDELDVEKSYFTISQFLKYNHGFTAIACCSDFVAGGALQALNDADLKVPQDVSLVGYDDLVWAKLLSPNLTTVRQPRLEQGEGAMHLMLELLNGNEPDDLILPPRLIVRNSTAVAPARKK